MSRPSYQTKAIVIGRTNFGEADRVIRLFTPDHGKVAAVAKGIRKIKSRSGGHLELLGEVELSLITGHNLETITSARLLWYPHQLVDDYERLSLAFAIAKMTDRITEPGQPAPALYSVIREALQALDGRAPAPLVELWVKLRTLDTLGYRPELGTCIICGQNSPDETYAFSAERGGLVCRSDAGALDSALTLDQIKFWRLLCDYNYGTISHIAGAETLAAATLAYCDNFYEHHLGITFRPNLTGETL
ncbi:MAG: DNA repair protein RecO [Candidatus Saccharimonadales bacterium]